MKIYAESIAASVILWAANVPVLCQERFCVFFAHICKPLSIKGPRYGAQLGPQLDLKLESKWRIKSMKINEIT